jgi:molybdopterin/thiamine biosynthesis adenylyltransferase
MDAKDIERYSRQLMLKEVGGAGQAALGKAKVLIVGAGGLGGPAGIYLAASGVGTLGLVDDDVVEMSNLHRQIQFQTSDIDQPKTGAMANHLSALNPAGHWIQHVVKIDQANAAEIISAYDLVLDGTDDFGARFAVNAACVKTRTPLISGALGRFDGQVCAFENTSGENKGPCYRCLVPDIPHNIETCAHVGVVGALAGIIGSMMALEAIKIITGAGTPLYGKLFLYDGLNAEARTVRLPRDPACKCCGAA